MKFDTKKQDNKAAAKPGDDPGVHPFVNAFANIGAILGRDIGVIALHSIERQKGNPGAILFWMNGRVPEPILNKLDVAMREKLYGAMLIPLGAEVPPFNFVDQQVQVATITIADGSKLVAFLKVDGLQADDSAA